MPGPGAHLIYTLGTGLGLKHLSGGKFSTCHCITYALNSLMGPDIGSVFEFLTQDIAHTFSSQVMFAVHHPIGYILLLGFPMSFFYAWLSKKSIFKSFRNTESTGITVLQSLALVIAGCLSHFFLDILFEENGHTQMYTWILSTGYWDSKPPIYPETIIVIGSLTLLLIFGFIYLNRAKPKGDVDHVKAFLFIVLIGTIYCIWCMINLYYLPYQVVKPPVGEEADLGVLTFLALFFFLPHCLCIYSLHASDSLTYQARHEENDSKV